MATPSLLTIDVPDSMKSRGQYVFEPQSLTRKDGRGNAIAGGPQILTWSFQYMTDAEMTYWVTTLLSGARSVQVTAAELWDHHKNEVNFTDGWLYEPTYDVWQAGLFWRVQVRIEHLLPIV